MNEEMPELGEMPERELSPLEKLQAAVQEFINETNDCPEGHVHLLDVGVLVYEMVSYSDDGRIMRAVDYTTFKENISMSATVGLLDLGREVISGDMFPDDDED